MSTITYRVRQGFNYLHQEADKLIRKIEGELVELEPAVGDGAHQLERVDPEAAAKAAAEADAEAEAKAAADAEAEAKAAADAEAAKNNNA